MKLQKTTVSQQHTTRSSVLRGFAHIRSVRGALKPMNLCAASANLPSLPFSYGWESDSRQTGRMTM